MKKLLIALAVTVAATPVVAQDVIISTGGYSEKSTSYFQKGSAIAKFLDKYNIDAEVVESSGSGQNIDCLSDRECHIAMIQADALNVNAPRVPVKAKRAHTEAVWWAFNTTNKKIFKDLDGIEANKDYAIALVSDSGAEYTFESFKMEDEDYKKNITVKFDNLYDAFDAVCEGRDGEVRIGGLIHVGGSLPSEVRYDFKDCVGIGQATDSDFNDAKDINGDKLYTDCSINKSAFAPLKKGGFGDQDTVCTSAMVVYSTELPKKVQSKVKRAVNKVVR